MTNEDIKLLAKNPGAERLAPVQRLEVKPPPALPPMGQMALISAQIVGNQARIRVGYRILSPHTRPVYAAARVVCIEPDLSFFSYGGSPLAREGSETVIIVNLGASGPVYPARVRLMLFESQGAMFFSTDLPWP